MKIALASACSCFAIFLCGCTPVVSVRPLFTQAEMETPYVDQRVRATALTQHYDFDSSFLWVPHLFGSCL